MPKPWDDYDKTNKMGQKAIDKTVAKTLAKPRKPSPFGQGAMDRIVKETLEDQ